MITKTWFLIILLTLLSYGADCKKQYTVPADRDINDVVSAIIQQKGLTIYNNVKGEHLFVRRHLSKLKIIGPEKLKTGDFNKMHILFLEYFNKLDENYLFFQNDVLKDFVLPNVKTPYELTDEKSKNEDMRKWNYYYQLTIPIFSADLNTAFVEVTFTCYGGKCGACNMFFLKRLKGKWTIAREEMLWIA